MKALLHKSSMPNKPVFGRIFKSVLSERYMITQCDYPLDCVFNNADTMDEIIKSFDDINLSEYFLVNVNLVPVIEEHVS